MALNRAAQFSRNGREAGDGMKMSIAKLERKKQDAILAERQALLERANEESARQLADIRAEYPIPECASRAWGTVKRTYDQLTVDLQREICRMDYEQKRGDERQASWHEREVREIRQVLRAMTAISFEAEVGTNAR